MAPIDPLQRGEREEGEGWIKVRLMRTEGEIVDTRSNKATGVLMLTHSHEEEPCWI